MATTTDVTQLQLPPEVPESGEHEMTLCNVDAVSVVGDDDGRLLVTVKWGGPKMTGVERVFGNDD